MADQDPLPTQYDSLATAYDLVWQVPAVRPLFPLLTSTLQAHGPYTGASVLDLACGTGIGLRLMRSLGASELVGVDISPQMLDMARATTPDVALHQADCTKPLDHLGLRPASFDVVLGMWLLNYCPSSAELRGMLANIATYLKPGGRFVGIIENHDIPHPACVADFKYGAMESNVQELANGEGWGVHVAFQTVPKIEFDAFRMKPAILEAEAAAAGLAELEYSKPGLTEVRQVIGEGIGGEEGKSEDWWSALLEEPPNYVLMAVKKSA
ncbi:S-adenosyl-L-methionine-dependent methyltransferase [Thozetella sp. PMI_491]|nr:S-adenosyl-L-methionine-dependent methyltransferase [Thozetella sp. PMI_491]